MDKFEYKGKAEIKHLNVRKEGPDDEKALAVDIKIQCVTSAGMLDFFHDGLKEVLFTDVGAVKNPLLKPLAFHNSIVNCELEILQQRYLGVDAGKFTLEPKDGNQVIVTFSVSIQPHGDEVAQLAEYVMDEVDIHIRPQPELDFGGAQEAADKLNNLAAEDGIKVTISDSAGNVLVSLGDDADPLYEQAVALVQKNRRASISLVQQHLRIGYNRAARLLNMMEQAGIVSAMNASGNREILVPA